MVDSSPPSFVSLREATLMFYRSPAVKFLLHFATFVFFLSFYSCFVIYYMKSCPLDPAEWVVTLFNLCYLLESLTMLFSYKGPLSLKMGFWFRCEWISIQALAAMFGLGAFVCKLFCIHMQDALVDNASTLYGASVLLTWIRLLSFYRCSRRLGPLWVLIRRMMYESVGFMLIFSVISLSAGMFIQVLMDIYHYSDPYAGSMQWLLLRPFFMFTGENLLKVVTTNVQHAQGQMQAVDGGKTSSAAEMSRSEAEAEGDRFVTIYTITAIVYFLLGNALMLNLLVAIFSEIFNKVFVRSDAEFKNEFLILTKEFELISVMPAPFSLIEITYKIAKQLLIVVAKIIRCCFSGQITYEDRLCCRGVSQSSVNEKNVINYFEEECLHEMLAEHEQLSSNELIVRDAIRRVDEQQGRLADMNIILCEINRLISEKFDCQRRRSMQINSTQISSETSHCG